MTGKEFCNRIDFCLAQKKLTRTALTKALGIASSTMSGWSASKQTIPKADVVEKIANFLEVSTDFLITGKDKSGMGMEEIDFISKLRFLSKENKNAVLTLLDSLYQQESQKLAKSSG